jgi:hypothetical protein
MAITQITDVIVPDEFTAYIVQNTVEKTALAQASVMQRNALMTQQLSAGADSFSVPHWLDLGNDEANIADDSATASTPYKLTSGKQVVRKSFLHNSWSAMNLASELSGDNALARIQSRAAAYWDRQVQRRLVATLKGILADNEANDSGDMLHDITGEAGTAANFSATAVIDAAATLGDGMDGVTAIAMHSDIYARALKNDLITTIPDSAGGFIRTFRGLAIIVDDSLPKATVVTAVGPPEVSHVEYVTVLFGPGAVGYGLTEPRIAAGTEVENLPSAGRGGGQQVLHSRINLAVHPLGFKWLEGSVASVSPTIAELALAANWDRVMERKAVPLAFLRSK